MGSNESHWRTRSRRIIQAIVRDNSGADKAFLKAAISAAYPFGERAYHPYKIWLSEVKAQMGIKPPVACWCAHGKASHRAHGACFAADCKCPGYASSNPRQAALPLPG